MPIVEDLIDNFLTNSLPYPKTVSIEPINICQLNCPLCPTGTRKLNYDRMSMPSETFKMLLDKMPFVQTIDLFKSGEPFLHPDIFEMIAYATGRGIGVVISTHFSFPKTEEFFESIITSGLNRVVVALDGASQETYSKYRRGGDFDLALSNLKKLIGTRERMQSKKPEIIWQFLVNRFNEHEIDAAKKMALDLKIAIDVRPIGLSDDVPDVELDGTIQERKSQWLPKNEKYISDCYKGEYCYPLSKGICTQLFNRAVIAVDGKVLPCCEVWDKESVFGDLMTDSFEAVWYGPKYMDARRRFLKRDHRPEVSTVCLKCRNFGATYSLKDKLRLLVTVGGKNLSYWKRRLLSNAA